MPPYLDPSALYGLLGTIFGACASPLVLWASKKTESKAEITKTKLALEQERTKAEVGTQAALVQRLQEQNETLQSRMDSMERDTRAIQQAAYERQDRARMALSIAMSYMTTLTGHINNRQPPPAPPMPTGLEGYIASLLQWSQEIPKQDNPEKPRDPPATG